MALRNIRRHRTGADVRYDAEQIDKTDWDSDKAAYLAYPVADPSDKGEAGQSLRVQRDAYGGAVDVLDHTEKSWIV